MPQFEYKAFVSYSWADASWGNWAHRTIEAYRTPKALIGQETLIGPVPRTLHPLFKDRDEEAAGASISAAVETALAASEFLLVICSPRSARSQWVNFEIAWFKTHRDPTKILALIVDGEPGASKIEGREDEECFPRALTHVVDKNLQITDVEEETPLAADARASGDGKQAAKLKLVAAMLGVKLSDLVKRDEKRRAFRTRMVVAGSLSVAFIMSGMAWFAIQARNEAQVQRDQAEGLVEYMISDLRENLQPKVQLEVLGGIADRANQYYAIQSNYAMDANALGRRSRVLELLAELEQDRGNTERSMQLFRQSVEASAQQLELDPDNPQRILEHAYSVQGLGQTAFSQGNLAFALTQMNSAADLLRKLSQRQDASDEWVAEYGSALANLGIVQYQQRQLDVSIGNLRKAIAIKRKAASSPAADWQDRFDFAITLAWMAKAKAANGQDDAASQLRSEENAIYDRMLASDPDDGYVLAAQVANSVNRAETHLLLNRNSEALGLALQASLAATGSMDSDGADKGNVDRFVRSQIVLAKAELANGALDRARAAAQRASTFAQQLAEADASRIAWNGDMLGNARILAIQIEARRSSNRQSCLNALRPIEAEAERLIGLSNLNPSEFALALATGRATMLLGDYWMQMDDPAKAKKSWETAKANLIKAGGQSGRPIDLSSKQLFKQLDLRIASGANAFSGGDATGKRVGICGS